MRINRLWWAIVIALCACSTHQTPAPTATVAVPASPAGSPDAAAIAGLATSTPHPAGVASNSDWIPQIGIIDGVEMVVVPSGCFMMGEDAGRGDELPIVRQCIDQPFYIDMYEVTNAQFDQFNGDAQAASRWTDFDLPRQGLTWFEARTYCESRGEGVRLPTELEWEYAARGPDSQRYPWGNAPIAGTAYFDSTGGRAARVGDFPNDVSWVGAFDMGGNIREWTSSIYSLAMPYPYAPDAREDRDDTDNRRVMRGGGFLDPPQNLRGAIRIGIYPDYSGTDFGVRCVRPYP